jgi:hypothetical protein
VRVLIVLALWWAAASLAINPALAGAVGPTPLCGACAHEDFSHEPGHCVRPARSTRSARHDRDLPAHAPALPRPPASRPLATEDGPRALAVDPALRPRLIASVTGAPRAPPRS